MLRGSWSFQKAKWKVKGKNKETVRRAYLHCALWGVHVYMHVCKCMCVFLWVVNQRPCVQGCTELIADPSSMAHLEQNKKHPHQKKPQQREFLKCCTVLYTSKRPKSATKHTSNPQPTMGSYKRRSWGQRDRGVREMGGTDLCPSLFNLQPFMFELFASCQQHICALCFLV